MPTEIRSIGAEYHSVKVALTTDAGERFFVVIADDGFTFMSDESSSGALYGTPINKTPDDVLEWIGGEGGRKAFRERAQVRPPVAKAGANLRSRRSS